jgi:hypothetical protein
METEKLPQFQSIENFPERDGTLALMIENRSVGGSIPPLGTILLTSRYTCSALR